METKPWWQSKTIWAGVIVVFIATYNGFRPAFAESFHVTLPVIPEFVYALLGALGVYGRNSTTKVIG